MEPKTYKVYHEKKRWYVYFKPENGKCCQRQFAYKRDMTDLIQALEDDGYIKAN